MSNTSLNTVRAGATLMKAIINDIAERFDYDATSMSDVREYVQERGGSFDAPTENGLQSMLAYASAKYGSEYVTTEQFGRALADAVKQTAREAATTGSKNTLSPAEQGKLAKTWNDLVEFAKINKGLSVEETLYIDSGFAYDD